MGTMLDRARPLSLWGSLWDAVQSLRPAFSNATTFMWFATVVAGMIVRVDLLGVTSIVRALNLRPELYHALLRLFHSTAVNLDRLTALWAHAVLLLFPSPVRVNGQAVASAIGIQHQARVHHGALPAGRQFARACGSERVRCTARRADP